MKLQLQNVGQAKIVVKDDEGYSNFVAEVATGVTKTYSVTRDVVQRLAPKLKSLEGEERTTAGVLVVGLRWSVLLDDDDDDRSITEGLAGLPKMLELQAANYSTGGGGTDVVVTGTGLLGNQSKASLAVSEGSAQLDLEAVAPGGSGNAVSVEVEVGGGALAVAVVANKLTITLPPAGDTVANIFAAINADADAKLLVQASEGAAGNITLAQDEAWLSGGKGPGVSLTLADTACVLTEVSDTQLTFDIPTGISTANYIVPLVYRNGPHVSMLSVPVVA